MRVIGFAGEELATLDSIGSVIQRGELANLRGTAGALVMGEPWRDIGDCHAGDPGDDRRDRKPKMATALARLIMSTFEMGAETDYSMVLVNLDGHPDDYWRELGQMITRVMLDNPMQAADFGRRLRGLESSVSVGVGRSVRRAVSGGTRWKRP